MLARQGDGTQRGGKRKATVARQRYSPSLTVLRAGFYSSIRSYLQPILIILSTKKNMAFLKRARDNKVEGEADEWGDGAMRARCPVALIESCDVVGFGIWTCRRRSDSGVPSLACKHAFHRRVRLHSSCSFAVSFQA